MARLELPVDARSVTAARRFVGGLDLPEPPRENASLLISELVTNAIIHADREPQAANAQCTRHPRLKGPGDRSAEQLRDLPRHARVAHERALLLQHVNDAERMTRKSPRGRQVDQCGGHDRAGKCGAAAT